MKITLAEGIGFCSMLEQKLEGQAHCALGGSVMYKGESDKDLDVIIYAHKAKTDKKSWLSCY